MNASESEGIEGKIFLVTGGLGFLGSALCIELSRRGAREVRAFDLRHVSPFKPLLLHNQITCIHGDITQRQSVEAAMQGADCVFHLAAHGISGKEALQTARIDLVNITATCNILDACVALGVPRLVYLSSYNVIFGGKEIRNEDESFPYFPIDRHVDHYSASKSIAERLVLKYNGRSLKGTTGKHLYTAALRPAEIYGPGEEGYLPRIITAARRGLFLFKIGDERVKTDFVYIDNIVHALLLTSVGLSEEFHRGEPVAAGQAYFISDGSPVNTFHFLRPLLISLGYEVPTLSITVPRALFLSNIVWFGYKLNPWLDRWWVPQPLMLPAEVYKVGVTHYFSYLKAKTELGYVPRITPTEGMAATVRYWKGRRRECVEGPPVYVWFFVLVGLLLTTCAAYAPEIGPIGRLRAFYVAIFRSLNVVRIVCVVSLALHVGEGVYAWVLARRVDPANKTAWFWQTFALGYFSLHYLIKKGSR